jgi:curved DNA-binding protein CbpA
MAFPILQGLFKYDLVDHYAILGVPLIADAQQIRQQYLNVAYRLHPDTCKAISAIAKKKANQLLSKWVNPAYEQLSKEQNRTDYLLVLSQIGKNMALESGKITLASTAARELFQAGHNVELVYLKLIQPLVSDQYSDLDRAFEYIAQISELNLVYLILKQGQGIGAKTQPQAPVREVAASQTATQAQEQTKASPVAGYLRRAQEYLQKGQPDRAILELRDALKLLPNEPTCHGLLGLAYLQQSQVTMAKVHITKAWQADPKDPLIVKAKQELDKVTTTDGANQPPPRPASGGLFGGLFGGKKN